MRAAALGLVLALPAAAQGVPAALVAGVPACLDSGAQACIGQAAAACFDAMPDGQTTVGMMHCLLAERDAWDRLLNLDYRAARAAALDLDAAGAPGAGERADRLRDAQRAWIAFRDAECALAYALAGGGTLRQIAGADCVMRLTAARSVELRALRHRLRDD